MISVNLWDHIADVWASKQLALDIESLVVPEHEWIPFDSSIGVLRNAEATSDTHRLHLWIWLMRSMILSVVACGVWAYFDSLSMIWVYPFPTNLALSWPDLGPITHLDSVIFAWSSLDSRLRGTGSYTSWPTLLNEMSSFLIASLTSFSEYPWRSPWYHSCSLRSWSSWSSWASSLWSLLTEYRLISKIPCLRDVIMSTSNSEGGCLPDDSSSGWLR